MIQKGNATLQRFPTDYFAADVDRSKCGDMRRHQTRSFARTTFGNVIYHIFSHIDVSYRNNGGKR